MSTKGVDSRPRSSPTRSTTRGQARGEATRAAIIDETVRCIVEEGFVAASAKHIAERAGVTWGVIQYHFGHTDGLMMAVVDEGYYDLVARLEGLEIPGGPLRERVDALLDAAWSVFSAPTSMAAMEITIATRSSRDKDMSRFLNDIAENMNGLGRHVADDLDAHDEAAFGDLLWGSLRGLVLVQMVVAEPVDFSQRLETIAESLTAYLLSKRPN